MLKYVFSFIVHYIFDSRKNFRKRSLRNIGKDRLVSVTVYYVCHGSLYYRFYKCHGYNLIVRLTISKHGIIHYATSAMKRFLTSLQHEPKASDIITLVKKTFFRTSIVRNFISRGVKMRINFHTRSVRKTAFTHSE